MGRRLRLPWAALALLPLLLHPLALPPAHAAEGAGQPYIREIEVPVDGAGPFAITVDQGGNVWFTLDNASKIGKYSPDDGSFALYDTPTFGRNLWGIITDRRGNVWFTAWDANLIVKFDPKREAFTEFRLPTPNTAPLTLLEDSEGNIWFTGFRSSTVGRLNPTTGEILEVKTPTEKSGPAGLALDSEGNIWLTESLSREGRIARLNPKTLEITEFIPKVKLFSPVGIAVDRDGAVWVADHGKGNIVRFYPPTDSWSVYATSPSPPEIYPVSLPNGLILDDRGNVWFAEHGGNKIGMFNPRLELFIEYRIPTSPAITLWLARDAEGNIWFTEWEGNKLGVLNPNRSPPFNLSLRPSLVKIRPGEEGLATVQVNGLQGTPLALNITGQTRGLEVTLASRVLQPKDGNAMAELTLRAAPSLSPGFYNLTVTATDGSLFVGKILKVRVMALAEIPNLAQNVAGGERVFPTAMLPVLAGAALAVFILTKIYFRGRRTSLRAGGRAVREG